MSSEKGMLLVLLAFVAVALLIRFFGFWRSFNKELRYLNGEINRTVGGEQERWKRARRRLFLSLIPFYTPRRRKKKSHQ